MKRAAAAEGHEGEARGIMAALHRDEADGAGHAGIGDAHDGFRRLFRRQAEAIADMPRQRLPRRLDIEPLQLAADGRSALMRPRTMFASVRVGRSLPWP